MNKLKTMTNKVIRVVLYLRLSDEDRDKLTKEQLSESIKNQELMLRDYAETENWQVVGVYNDEDWSGGDSTRPNFNKMISECEKGNVDIVLVKTQARFARDSELIEKYIHNLFHEWGVRFISTVDRIDNTKKETKKTSQILGLTDEWMLEDTSINIRDTFRSKRKKGQFTGSFTKYGYMKDPENKNHLIIDPIPAEIVKRIFNEYWLGYGIDKIANNLNEENVLSPLEYKKQNGCKLYIPLLKDYLSYDYIEKAGTYIIEVHLTNYEEQKLNNLITFNYITTDKINFNNKCEIKLKQFSSKNLKVYYSTKKDLDIKDFNEKDFVEIKENDIFPKDITCIATKSKEVDRTHTISFQLQVKLKENRNHEKYYIKTQKYVDNIDVDLDFETNIRRKLLWSNQTIKGILKDEVYIGNMVQFKSTTVSYKNHTVIYNDDEDRIRKNNTHDAIIDKAIFYTIQERLTEKTRSCNNGNVHVLASKIYCENCGQIFTKAGRLTNKNSSYFCCKDKRVSWVNCDNKKLLREDELHEFLLDKINAMIKKYYSENKLNELKDNLIEEDLFKDKLIALEKENIMINKELESKVQYFQKLYEDRTSGLIPDKEFHILVSKYKDDTSKLEERLKSIKNEITITNEKKDSLKTKDNIFKKYKRINELSVEIVSDFINKILIGKYDETSNSRDIKVLWNFTI